MPSRVKELADAEAARVEAELGDESAQAPGTTGEEEDAEAEAEAEAHSGELDEEALHAESQRHVEALTAILGPIAPQAAACVYCEGSGVTFEPLAPPPELADDPLTERCAPCRGLGLVKTGSLREGQDVRSCVNCSGNGYTTKAVQLPPPQQVAALPAPAFPENGEPLPAHLPPGTLDQLRAAGYVVVPPPPGGQSIAP